MGFLVMVTFENPPLKMTILMNSKRTGKKENLHKKLLITIFLNVTLPFTKAKGKFSYQT